MLINLVKYHIIKKNEKKRESFQDIFLLLI